MLKIIHRVNKIEDLKKISQEFGVEVDIRRYNNQLVLNHEPFEDGYSLDEYLSTFNDAFIILVGISPIILKQTNKIEVGVVCCEWCWCYYDH